MFPHFTVTSMMTAIIRVYRWNWGSGRVLPPNPTFHKSVETRKDFLDDYPPKTWEGIEKYIQ